MGSQVLLVSLSVEMLILIFLLILYYLHWVFEKCHEMHIWMRLFRWSRNCLLFRKSKTQGHIHKCLLYIPIPSRPKSAYSDPNLVRSSSVFSSQLCSYFLRSLFAKIFNKSSVFQSAVFWNVVLFWRNVFPASSVSKSKPYKEPAWSRQQALFCLLLA
jgi:hypothetical protein